MDDCIFCKIVAGEIPTAKVYEDESTLAFLDIRPANKGHTLVIPRRHFANLYDTPDATLGDLMRAAKRVARAVKTATAADGVNLLMNNELAAGQDIFHVHLHLVPRFSGRGHSYFWDGHDAYAPGEAAALAEKIHAALDGKSYQK